MKRSWTFVVGLLTGMAVVAAVFLSSAVRINDSWVIDGIGYKAAFRE